MANLEIEIVFVSDGLTDQRNVMFGIVGKLVCNCILILFIIVLEPNYGEERIILDRVEVVVLCWRQHRVR